MAFHDAIEPGDLHRIDNLSYPDAANRIAGINEGTGIVATSANLFQFAKQDDDDSLWMLVGIGPPLVWAEIPTGCDGTQFWQRVGTTLSPTTSGDDMFVVAAEVDALLTVATFTTVDEDGIHLADEIGLALGSSDDVLLEYSPSQVADALMIGLSADSLNMILATEVAVAADFDFGHETSLDPTWIGHSRNSATNEYWLQRHDTEDKYHENGVGSDVHQFKDPRALVDDGSFDLKDGRTTGMGYIMFLNLATGNQEGWAQFRWAVPDSEVDIITGTDNVVNSDTDGNFCIFINSSAVRVRNRIGSTRGVMFRYEYFVPPIA